MQAPDAPVSATPHENQTVVAYVETTSTGFEDVFALVAGLGAGKLYYLAVQAVNPGGGGDGARITVRPFGATGGPEGVQVMIASSKAILLTWRPPLHLPLCPPLRPPLCPPLRPPLRTQLVEATAQSAVSVQRHAAVLAGGTQGIRAISAHTLNKA